MRNEKIFFIAALWLAGQMPGTVRAQSESSSQETQALRKQLDEMRTQMNNMQARLDQLEAAKAQPNANQPARGAPVSSQKQDGTLFVGSEFLYGGQVLKDGSFAYAPRIQFSAKYSFVRIDPPQE